MLALIGRDVNAKIWIFGLVERHSNRLLLFPVVNRKEETLTAILRKHVALGSTIYSDGWSSYQVNMPKYHIT